MYGSSDLYSGDENQHRYSRRAQPGQPERGKGVGRNEKGEGGKMSYDLRSHIKALEKHGLLRRVRREVDKNWELSQSILRQFFGFRRGEVDASAQALAR